MAGRAKENPPGGSLKYLFVYLKEMYRNVVTVYIYISFIYIIYIYRSILLYVYIYIYILFYIYMQVNTNQNAGLWIKGKDRRQDQYYQECFQCD